MQIIDVQKIVNGLPPLGGKVWIGEYASDPQENPVSAFLLDGSEILTPLKLDNNGFAIDPSDGKSKQIYMDRDYAITITDSLGGLVYSAKVLVAPAGATATLTNITSITVVNGIITDIQGS
jgi:hypothetical protein